MTNFEQLVEELRGVCNHFCEIENNQSALGDIHAGYHAGKATALAQYRYQIEKLLIKYSATARYEAILAKEKR